MSQTRPQHLHEAVLHRTGQQLPADRAVLHLTACLH
jgi:hypothetical protein